MQEASKISIITINLNNKIGLEKTMKSVLAQPYKNVEYILIDGGSEDGSREVIATCNQAIHYWVSEPDKGIYHAMNKGIAKATGTYCLFLNSGDWLVDNSLTIAAEACRGEDILYFRCYLMYADGRLTEQNYPPTLTMQSFFRRTIGHQSTLIKRELFLRYGNYNETYRVHADYDFWIRAIIFGDCACKYVGEFLTTYDMSGLSSTSTQLSESEIARILAMHIPSRILADYESWQAKTDELQLWEWIKSKRALYVGIRFVYRRAIDWVAVKRKRLLTSPKSKHV